MNNKLFVNKSQITTVLRLAAFSIFIIVISFSSNAYGQNPSEAQNAEVSEWIVSPQHNQLIEAGKTSQTSLPIDKISRAARANQSIVDGSLDLSFGNASIKVERARVEAVVLQPDGKILIGGSFTEYNGSPASMVVRLNADGTRDTTFNPPSMNEVVMAIALQPDRS